MKNKELLDWFLEGGRVWKSKNKGWFARTRGVNPFEDTFYAITARDAAEKALAARASSLEEK